MPIYPPRDKLIAYYEAVYSRHQQIADKVAQSKSLLVDYGRVFESVMSKATGRRLLDIGCGSGELVSRYASQFESVAGTDVSENALKVARAQTPAGDFRKVEDMVLPFPDGSFDFVVSNQVLEHIYPSETALFFSEISRVLAKGGQAVISTPNGDELRRRILWLPVQCIAFVVRKPETFVGSRLYWIQNKFLSGGTAKAKLFAEYGFLEHINIVTSKTIRDCVQASGLQIASVEYDGFRPLFPRLLRIFGLLEWSRGFEARLSRGRKLLMSNQTWTFTKAS
jgi:SAM-dependent methyltransferase